MTNYHYTEFKVKLYSNVYDAASIGGDVHVNGVDGEHHMPHIGGSLRNITLDFIE